jgi:hypothetical protein
MVYFHALIFQYYDFGIGEVLDLAADTGGFNLQAAFSTGWLAGKSAARLAKGIDRH